jgi:hypothetical protein
MSEQVPAVNRKLPVSAVLFGVLGGLVGGAIGAVLGIAVGAGLAAAFHVPQMEGAAGYFAGSIALIVIALATPASILLTLYWKGVRRIWLLVGLVIVCLSIVAIGAAGFGIWYSAQPHILNRNRSTPQLQFEVKPPDGQSAESLAGVEPELDTDRNVMPGYWNKEGTDPGVRSGAVEVYFRTKQRFFILKFPNHEDRIFDLHLPANPMKPRFREWSVWKKPDFIAKGEEQPVRFSGGNEYQIRFRMDYRDD